MEGFVAHFLEYGFIWFFGIVLLEYLNFPGFPSGIIMPVAGFLIERNNLNFIEGVIVSVLAGMVGSTILYMIGRYGGSKLLDWYTKKFPKQKEGIDKNIKLIKEKGNIGIFLSKLIPVARTIIPVPAGAIKFDFVKYSIFSALGITVWNFSLMWSGYYFGEKAIRFFINL